MGSRFNQDTLHQRTQLFGPNFDTPVERASSPYNNSSVDYSQSTLAQLESQSDAYIGLMRNKVNTLRNLSMKMGEEIRGSNSTLDELGGTFDRTKVKLRKTFIRMKVIAKRSKISIKTWLMIFTAVGLLFFYVWVF